MKYKCLVRRTVTSEVEVEVEAADGNEAIEKIQARLDSGGLSVDSAPVSDMTRIVKAVVS